MVVLLLVVLAVGAVGVTMAVYPGTPSWSRAMPPLWIVALVLVGGLQRTLGGNRWDRRVPEVRAILEDEWRRSNMERARRVAFTVVLGAQLPLGLLLGSLPTARAVLAMGVATITLGLVTLLALFLHYDRDPADAG